MYRSFLRHRTDPGSSSQYSLAYFMPVRRTQLFHCYRMAYFMPVRCTNSFQLSLIGLFYDVIMNVKHATSIKQPHQQRSVRCRWCRLLLYKIV